MLSNQGFDDIKLKIGDNALKCVKSLLCCQNALFSKLLNDSMCENGELMLNSKCSVESIQLLITYYGFGEIEITKGNVIDLLKTCVFYDDMKIVSYCVNYILNHFDVDIFINILNCKELINANCCERIQELISQKSDELSRILMDEKKIIKMNYDSLIYALNQENVIYQNESKLFNNLCEWLENEKIKNKKDKKCDEGDEIEFEEKKSEILKYVNWKEINVSCIKEENIDYIPKMNIKELIESSKSINRFYLPSLYKQEDFYNPESLAKTIKIISESDDISELMKMCSLLIYYPKKLIAKEIILKLLNKLLSVFSSLPKVSKRNVAKLLAVCCGNVIKTEQVMKENKEAFTLLLLNYDLLNESVKLSYYSQLISLLKDTENYRFYDEDDYVLLEKQNFNKSEYRSMMIISVQYYVGHKIDTKLPVDGFGSCFKCDLPEGLSIDYYSGRITGVAKKAVDEVYTVYYRNPSKAIFKIKLKIVDSIFSNSNSTSLTAGSLFENILSRKTESLSPTHQIANSNSASSPFDEDDYLFFHLSSAGTKDKKDGMGHVPGQRIVKGQMCPFH